MKITLKLVRKIELSLIIIWLLVMSVMGIGLLIYREVTRTPAEYFVRAHDQIKENNYRGAVSNFKRVLDSDQKDLVASAAWDLGNIYRLGKGDVAMNPKLAEEYLTKSSELGFALAQYDLALMYDVGDKIPENREKAVYWMQEATKSGYPEALYSMGVWIERGYLGKPDMKKVLDLYEQAANKGHTNAKKSLVVLYAEGHGGFPKNLERKQFWLRNLNKGK
jgi:TPR repeat protein